MYAKPDPKKAALEAAQPEHAKQTFRAQRAEAIRREQTELSYKQHRPPQTRRKG